MGRVKKTSIKKPKTAVEKAALASELVGKTRKGRDSLTRVANPIKVADTQARQWNRWSP